MKNTICILICLIFWGCNSSTKGTSGDSKNGAGIIGKKKYIQTPQNHNGFWVNEEYQIMVL
jgi:hypothetical protein